MAFSFQNRYFQFEACCNFMAGDLETPKSKGVKIKLWIETKQVTCEFRAANGPRPVSSRTS